MNNRDSHPVCIYALGQFEIVINGIPLRFAFKTPRKPLDLLKCLLTLGGRGISHYAICEALWPEYDAPIAHRALHTTLFRLRNILQSKQAILLGDNHVTLNAHYCWVDAWAFEKEINEAHAAEDITKTLQIYRGPFMGDAECPLAFQTRERLRRKFLHAVLQLGQGYEHAGDNSSAIYWYESALSIEPTSEELHLHLIKCLVKHGQLSTALATYERCRTMLAKQFGLGASPAMERIIREAISIDPKFSVD